MDISGKVTISGAVNVDGSAAIGVDPGDATADAGDILAPKTAYLSNGKKATGTIPTRTSSDISDLGGDVTIPEGYYASPVHVDLTGYAPLDSPAFAGTPTAPTPTSGDSSTKLATTAFVSSAIGDRIFIVEYGAMNPTADYNKITAAIASGFAVLCRFRLDTTTPVYYYAPLTEKRKIGGKEWYVFESVLNNDQTDGWSNITGAALLQRRILKKINNTCSWALETVALPCPTLPTGNGNYKLRLKKVSNGVTYSWVADT